MKEITITNPAGITLNTKNTIVDDNIKIRLASGMFGNSEAKLVARGTIRKDDEYYYSCELNNSLESNKLYALICYIPVFAYQYDTIFFAPEINNLHHLMYFRNSSDDYDVLITIEYDHSNTLYIFSSNDENLAFDEEWEETPYIEVYELPFTLGGAE